MKNFTLIHETPDHFVLHNGKSHFHIAKNGIDVPTADKIRALAEGGEIKKDTDLDNPPEANLDETYKAQPLPTPEPQQKRREIQSEMPEPEGHAHGGKLTAKARAEIPQKNFALPNGRYPIEDASHARNALARVSEHGSPEEKATVRSKVHSKYPGIEQAKSDGGAMNYDDGGQVQSPPIDPDKAQSAQDSMRKAFGYSDGGKAGAPQQIATPDPTPTPTIAPPAANPDVTAALRGAFGQRQPASENKADGGPVASNAVQDISHETQSQAIGRYAAGNPANLAEGGATHTSHGKYHFHFYDGGPVTHSDKQPDAPPTPLDNYTNMADGGPTMQLSAADVDPNAVINPGYNKPTELQQEIDQATQDQSAPSPEQSANNLAGTMGQQAPLQQDDQSSSASSPAPVAGKAVAPQNQISMVPKSLPPNPGQNVDLMTEFNKNMQGEQEALQQGSIDQAKGFAAQNDILKQHLNQEANSYQKYQQDQLENTTQANALFNAVASSKVDPNKYWNDKSTGGKIAAAVGLILGGVSQGLGGRNSNPAMDVIQNAIKEDISAQQNNQSQAMNLYKMGLQKYRDRAAAEDYAQLHGNVIAQGMLQMAANKAAIPAAANNAKMAISQLGLQNMQLRTNLGMQQAALNAMGTPSSTSGVNPDKMRLLTMSGMIPKEEVPIADKENSDYQKLSDTLDHTDDVFNQAKQNANYTERALPGWTPTIRDASKNYEAVTNAWLGNITKETEGRVTPIDVELMRSSLPKAGDSPQVYQTKLNSVKDMVRQKFAFPTLQKYRLLSPNDPISTPGATRKKRFNETPK